MIRLFLGCVKLSILAAVVLLISQIPVGQRRICDHVHAFTQSAIVQKPVRWISERFDFSEGRGRELLIRADRAAKRARHSSRTTGSDRYSESERVSGLMKDR